MKSQNKTRKKVKMNENEEVLNRKEVSRNLEKVMKITE